MKRGILLAVILFAGFFLIFSAVASAIEAVVGKTAEDFTLPDSTGKTHSLSDYKGKIVVLEWLNHGCPFVKKHYKSGNMQELQKMYAEKGVVWFSIVSSAPGDSHDGLRERTDRGRSSQTRRRELCTQVAPECHIVANRDASAGTRKRCAESETALQVSASY